MRALLEAFQARLTGSPELLAAVGSSDRIVRGDPPTAVDLSDTPGHERLVTFRVFDEKPHRIGGMEDVTVLVTCMSALGDLDSYDLTDLVRKTVHEARFSHEGYVFFFCRFDGYEKPAFVDTASGAWRTETRYRVRYQEQTI